MVEKAFQIVWTKRSQQHLKHTYEYISKDSAEAASKLINALIAGVEKAKANPELYPPDKFKNDNDGSFRAFEKYRYRISYRYGKNIIRVLAVRHTSMEPKHY